MGATPPLMQLPHPLGGGLGKRVCAGRYDVMAVGYAFAFIIAVGAGIWTPPERMWFPTLAACEAARQGVEEMGAATTECERASLRPTHGIAAAEP
jgi:hypothetical protein